MLWQSPPTMLAIASVLLPLSEPKTIAWLEETVASGSALLDIGANVGVFSVFTAVKHPGAKVFAFEPEIQSAAALAETIALNALSIKLFCVPVSERMHHTTFHIQGAVAAGLSDHQIDAPRSWEGHTFKPTLTIGAVAFSIDDLVGLGAIDSPTHIKIDVDGHEVGIVRGATKALQTSVQWLAAETMTDKERTELEALMIPLGFEQCPTYTSPGMPVYRRKGV